MDFWAEFYWEKNNWQQNMKLGPLEYFCRIALRPLSGPTSMYLQCVTTQVVFPTFIPPIFHFVITHHVFNLHSVNQNQALQTQKNRFTLVLKY